MALDQDTINYNAKRLVDQAFKDKSGPLWQSISGRKAAALNDIQNQNDAKGITVGPITPDSPINKQAWAQARDEAIKDLEVNADKALNKGSFSDFTAGDAGDGVKNAAGQMGQAMGVLGSFRMGLIPGIIGLATSFGGVLVQLVKVSMDYFSGDNKNPRKGFGDLWADYNKNAGLNKLAESVGFIDDKEKANFVAELTKEKATNVAATTPNPQKAKEEATKISLNASSPMNAGPNGTMPGAAGTTPALQPQIGNGLNGING